MTGDDDTPIVGEAFTEQVDVHEPRDRPDAFKFSDVVKQALALLHESGRVSYGALKMEFSLDDEQLDALTEELLFSHAQIQAIEGRGLVWSDGAALPDANQTAAVSAKPLAPVLETSSPAVERRQITIMFCDLVGSTALSEKLDPEDLRELMMAYQKAAGGVIERYDGHVAQYLGDGLMVYFGWPVAHEEDAGRAVRAGLELIEVVRGLHTVEPLQVRIGIATGPVVVGETGGGDASIPKAAVGETPNVAARMQGLAGPEEMVITPTTRRLAGGAFNYEDLGEKVLKGITDQVRAWRVISTSAVKSRFEAQTMGRPSIDPVLFFRMQLISFLYGMKSDRELCREVHLNLAYRWFCRLKLTDPVPHHSSMTRIRDRFGEAAFAEIFEQLVSRWKIDGYIRGRRIVVDASLVEANAAVDSLVEREDGDPDAQLLKQYQRRYHDFREGTRRRKYANQTHVSRTDAEASLVSRRDGYKKLCYKAHFAIDAESRMVTDPHATTGARHEGPVLPERIEHLTERLELPVNEVIADRGYGRGPTYAKLRNQKIRYYIPLHDTNTGRGKLTPSSFKYDRRNDRYRCPRGHYLYPYEKAEKDSIKRYRVTGGHCRTCSMSGECLPDSQKHQARFVYRGLYQDEIEAVRRRANQRMLSAPG